MLKDTDIDDLFRRASDKYPLRTDGADWSKLAAALDNIPAPGELDGTDTEGRRRNRRLFWLLLFLPLGGAGYYALHHPGNGSSHNVTAVQTAMAGDKQSAGTNETPATGSDQAAMTSANPAGGVAAEKGTTGSSAARESVGSTTAASPTGVKQPGAPKTTYPAGSRPQGTVSPARLTRANQRATVTASATPDQQSGKRGTHPATAAVSAGNETGLQPAVGQSVTAAGPAGFRTSNSRGGRAGTNRPKPGASVTGSQSGTVAASGTNGPKPGKGGPNGSPASGFTAGANEPLSLRWSGADIRLAPTTEDFVSLNVLAPESLAGSDPDNQIAAGPKATQNAAGQKTAGQKPAAQKTGRPKPTHYFYAGIFAAPDLSTVKMQRVNGVGTTFGALIGYAINAHWSIETGASVDRKKYYTQGEYFDTSHVHMQPNSQLLNASGTCYMWEIPLNVRYTFNPDAKTKWFGTAGVSTYLMSKENYSFEIQKNTYTWYYSWNNKQPSQYPFSIVNLSAGFEQRLGRVGSLRVEPYVRLPLGGIGTGKLPIMSAGINVGITRRLW